MGDPRNGGPGNSPGKKRYFDATSNREIHDLKEELNHSSKEKKKEALKKVIQWMTGGNDVSSLFPDVVNCMQTSSLDLKKLVYLYVINYAKAQPDLAILAIHSFRKDANDQHNPLLRALAVRTMGYIRLEQMTEYLLEPLRRSCKDPDAYVRKTATICIAKLFDINAKLVEEQGFIEILRDMLGDANPMVVANAVASLCEISSCSRRNYLQLKEATINKLLPALNECSEWGQVFILDALAMYDPPNSKAAETILERGVIVRLSHANSAVVLSAVKVITKFMDRISDPSFVRKQCKRMTAPLVTLLTSEPEIQYVVLKNISLIVQKLNQPQILQSEARMFVCKYNDPSYVKMEKISVMVQLAHDSNIDQVLSEFREYASEVDIECVRRSVRAIGQCAIRLETAAERCIDCLLDLIKTKVSYVVQEAVTVIKDIFRKYPGRYEIIICHLYENLEGLDEPEARSSMIWIIGEYAERINNSAELLESFLDTFHEEAPVVQLQLLTSIVKLYLKCPDKAGDLVKRMIKAATDECTNPDLRDRGYMYWRLLTHNPDMAKQVVCGERPTISDNSFGVNPRILDRLIANISTLASVYHQVPESFIVPSSNMNASLEENGDNEEEVQEAIEQVENEMRIRSRAGARYVEDEDEDDSDEGSDRSSSGSEAGDGKLRLTDGIRGAAPPPPLRPLSTVLSEQQKGSQGICSGLRVAATVVRGRGGAVGMQFKIGNFSNAPMGGFMVQFNKNPFGLAPTGPFQVGEVAPNGGTADTTLPLVPNQPPHLSNTAPTLPLNLQIAMKTRDDIWYFQVGYDLSAVLQDSGPVNPDTFRDTWQRVPAEQKLRTMGGMEKKAPPDSVIGRLQQYYTYFVTKREAPDSDVMYFSARTANQLTIYCELMLQRGGNGVQLVACSEAAPLVPAFQSFISEVLHVRWQPGGQP